MAVIYTVYDHESEKYVIDNTPVVDSDEEWGGISRPRNPLSGKDCRCSFCKKDNATGYWQELPVEINVCRECATTVLPVLIADALIGESVKRTYPSDKVILCNLDLRREMREVEANFYKGASLAMYGVARNMTKQSLSAKSK